MTEYPIPDPGLTESTRQMYTEKYAETFKNFVDEVFRPNHVLALKPVDHSILLDELALLKEKYLNGTPSDEHKFAAAVITAAMAVIIGIWNANYVAKHLKKHRTKLIQPKSYTATKI